MGECKDTHFPLGHWAGVTHCSKNPSKVTVLLSAFCHSAGNSSNLLFLKRNKDLDSLVTGCQTLAALAAVSINQLDYPYAKAVIFNAPWNPGDNSTVTTAVDWYLEVQPQPGMLQQPVPDLLQAQALMNSR